MPEEPEIKETPINLEHIATFLDKKLTKKEKEKTDFDYVSTVAQLLNLAGNRDLTYDLLARVASLSSIEDPAKREEAFNQIRDYMVNNTELNKIAHGETKLVDFFTNNRDRILNFFNTFQRETNSSTPADFAMIRFACETDMASVIDGKTIDEDIFLQLMDAKIVRNEQDYNMHQGLEKIQEDYEAVQRYNYGQWPNNTLEITEDTALIGVTVAAGIFPPIIIFASIIHLLHSNNNELTHSLAEEYQKGKQSILKAAIKSEQESSIKPIKAIRDEALTARKRIFKRLYDQLPGEYKPYVETYVRTATSRDIANLQQLREDQTKLRQCNGETQRRLLDKDKKKAAVHSK